MNKTIWSSIAAWAVVCLFAPADAQASAIYWNLFNIEGENSIDAAYVTYATLDDMLTDSNRLGQFSPNTTGNVARNVVGSGSDGTTYWSLFNIEGENSIDAAYVTYATLTDMLTDSNRLGQFSPNTTGGVARNVVGSGSDGSFYWNLFNIEGENSIDAAYVTYATLDDMLTDSNRLGQFSPNTTGNVARNVVGSGASIMVSTPPMPVPEPASVGLLMLGLLCLGQATIRRRPCLAESAGGRKEHDSSPGQLY